MYLNYQMKHVLVVGIGLVSIGFDLGTASEAHAGIYQMSSAASNSVLSGWPASSAVDGNIDSSYGSGSSANATNSANAYLAAWLPGAQTQPVNEIILTARMLNGVPQAFPVTYQISITNAQNTAWMSIGTFSIQPNASGIVTIALPSVYLTAGVLIQPTQLGRDSYGGYYFQMAEVNLANQTNLVQGSTSGVFTPFTLNPGEYVQTGNVTLLMQSDGNLVLYQNIGASNQTALWGTSQFTMYDAAGFTGGTGGLSCANCYANFQSDGNLVLYNPNSNYNPYRAYWGSGTGGNTGATLHISETAPYVSVVNSGGSPLWGPIYNTLVLQAGQAASFGNLTLAMQSDGNFVLYQGSKALWATSQFPGNDAPGLPGGTGGMSCANCYAVFQSDGNLVLYDPSSNYNSWHSYWASNTGGNPGAILNIAANAPYISIISQADTVLWDPIYCSPGYALKGNSCVWDGIIDMWQVIGAFANRHPNEAKQQTAYIETGSPLADFNDAYRCERLTTAGDVIGDWIGYPSGGSTSVIYDWYGQSGANVGFKGTFPINPVSPTTLWKPLIPISTRTFTVAAETGVKISASVTTCTSPNGKNSFNCGSASPSKAWNTIGFAYQNFGGTIGNRWVVTQTGNDGEVMYYDLGPAENVYDPEFGLLEYYQNQTPYPGTYQNHSGTLEEQFGSLVPANEVYNNCHGSFYSYFSF